jgi:hypothetical protein
MAQFSSNDVLNTFKRVYGDFQYIMPDDMPIGKMIPFSQKQKVGEKYIELVSLSRETGWTLLGSGSDAVAINPAIAGVSKQVEVSPYASTLTSYIPWQTMSRSAGQGEKAFFDATKEVVKNNARSHAYLLEIIRLYGQASALLGYVSYYSGTYRGASLTTGTGTVNGISFTNGVNTSSKYILLDKGSFAAGIWVGMEGARVEQVNSSGTAVASGALVGVNPDYGYIEVDFTPVAASSTTSHRLKFAGMGGSEAVGINYILSNTGTLFGVTTSDYSLWQGVQVNCSNTKFSLSWLQTGVAQAVGRGGLTGDLEVLVNPRTWAKLVVTEAGARVYDDSYKPGQAENGFESIKFYTQTGKAMIRAHRCVKEGEAYALHMADWSRSGSAEVGFGIPGMDGKDVIFPVESQTAYAFRSYADQYVFNHAPARSIIFTGIDDESAT